MSNKTPIIVKSGEGEGLRATGGIVRFICPADSTGHAWSLTEAELPCHAGPPLHDHPWDEGYYVLEGEVRFTLGTETVTARKGDFLYAPAGTPHGFQGASEKPARVLFLDVPAHAEAFFRDMDSEIKEFPRDAAKIPEIGARHKIRFIR